jgi:hypothetical protein
MNLMHGNHRNLAYKRKMKQELFFSRFSVQKRPRTEGRGMQLGIGDHLMMMLKLRTPC